MNERYTPEHKAELKARSIDTGLPMADLEQYDNINPAFDFLLKQDKSKAAVDQILDFIKLNVSLRNADIQILENKLKGLATADQLNEVLRKAKEILDPSILLCYVDNEINQLKKIDNIIAEKLHPLEYFETETLTDAAVVLSNLQTKILCNPAGAQTMKLVKAELMEGYLLWFKNISSFGVTINPDDPSETIDEATSLVLASKGKFAELFSDGAVWHSKNKN